LRPGFIFQNTSVRCTACGTRSLVTPGLFRKRVVDWETPEERRRPGDEPERPT
jgi:hypothetical protein